MSRSFKSKPSELNPIIASLAKKLFGDEVSITARPGGGFFGKKEVTLSDDVRNLSILVIIKEKEGCCWTFFIHIRDYVGRLTKKTALAADKVLKKAIQDLLEALKKESEEVAQKYRFSVKCH